MSLVHRESSLQKRCVVQVIRFFLFVVATPFMNLRGYHLDARECTVMGWSGLRGAVGLALGLQIYGDQEIHDESFRNKQFFHIGCVAVLTILFQGSSMKLLLNVRTSTISGKFRASLTENWQYCRYYARVRRNCVRPPQS